MSKLEDNIKKRKTFAIISHPDAGKTTLTEKLLLFGGAISMAGAVKSKGEKRRTTSDWMKVEQERGISVASSVMTFIYNGINFNLLDTPGHEDFSEDTYRVLTAVDSSIMVIDSAKGIEAQTKKLFEVCRLRDVPIATFINKLDRNGRDPFDLLDEIEQTLALEVTPASWPIGMGKEFLGCYDILHDELLLLPKGQNSNLAQGIKVDGLNDPQLDELLPEHAIKKLREDVEMVRELCPKFDLEAYEAGYQTPIFFGSAVNNFGVREMLNGLVEFAPTPISREAKERTVEAIEEKPTGFIFKIQANTDPKHRDRIAFMRLCSGKFTKGQKLLHIPSNKSMNIHSPIIFMAQEREIVEEAYSGDIIGIPNHGNLKIGDSLTSGEILNFKGIPDFAPEIIQKARPKDPLKAKHLGKALQQIAEEGSARVFKPLMGSDWIVGVVGVLQFEVLADRLRTEYNVDAIFEQTSLNTTRWLFAENNPTLKNFIDTNRSAIAFDIDETPVFLARNAWHLEDAERDNKEIEFVKVREHR